jgi:hypothetical protein
LLAGIGWLIDLTGQPERATRPEKTDHLCEKKLGFGSAKAEIRLAVQR